MQESCGLSADSRINCKLVASRVNGNFVVSVALGDIGVAGKLAVELGEVTNIVDGFLELSDKAGRK